MPNLAPMSREDVIAAAGDEGLPATSIVPGSEADNQVNRLQDYPDLPTDLPISEEQQKALNAFSVPQPGKGLDLIGRPTVAALAASAAIGRGAGAKWYAENYSYTEAPASASDAHLVTSGGAKLYIDPVQGTVPVAALPATPDPVTRLNTAFVIAKALGYDVDARGLGDLFCTGVLYKHTGVNSYWNRTKLHWEQSVPNQYCIQYICTKDKFGYRQCTHYNFVAFGVKGGGTHGIYFTSDSAQTPASAIKYVDAILDGFENQIVFGDNCYIVRFFGSSIINGGIGIQALVGNNNNSGERWRFEDTTVSGNVGGVRNNCSLGRMVFENSSIDYNLDWDIDASTPTGGKITLTGGCRLEMDANNVTGPRVKTCSNAERSGFITMRDTDIIVRNSQNWPANVCWADGVADLKLRDSHLFGVARNAPALMSGGGKVDGEGCTFSTTLSTNIIPGVGRGVNRDGGFEDATLNLWQRGFYARGNTPTAYDTVSGMSIALNAAAAFSGTQGMRVTIPGGTGFKQIWLLVPSRPGSLPSVRMKVRAAAAVGDFAVKVFGARAKYFDNLGTGTATFAVPVISTIDNPKFLDATYAHTTTWQDITLAATGTPETNTMSGAFEYLAVCIDLNNTSSAAGPVDFDEIYVDYFGGRKR